MAVDESLRRTGIGAHPKPLRVLVAEAGGCCISVFEVWAEGCFSLGPSGFVAPQVAGVGWAHVCDICTEQLGTGLHKPLEGQWSWLGLTVTEGGDVIVTDMDQGQVYLV